ncbi:MAG: transporter [Steroidobacteraceae bacterium]
MRDGSTKMKGHAPRGNVRFQQCRVLALTMAFAVPSFGDDPVPNKDDYTLLDPTPDADLRSFNTDRPPKANSPFTVDAGHFQYETDIAVYSYGDSGAVKTRAWTLVDPTLKLGLTNTMDAELQVTPYESLVTRSAASTTSISGVGDSFARLKVNVLGDDHGDVAVALLPYVKLPTAQSGLGNGKVEGGLILPVSVNAPGGFTVIVMPEFDYLKDATDSGYHGALDFLVNVSHPLDARWTLYTEVFTTQSWRAREQPIYTLDAALTYALKPNMQLDFGGNIGLNGAAPRVQLYGGLSQRF